MDGEKFEKFCGAVRKNCSDSCRFFLIGRCKKEDCNRPHKEESRELGVGRVGERVVNDSTRITAASMRRNEWVASGPPPGGIASAKCKKGADEAPVSCSECTMACENDAELDTAEPVESAEGPSFHSPQAAEQRSDGKEVESSRNQTGGRVGGGSLTRALILFAGRRRSGSLSDALRRAGWVVDEVDVQIDAERHDLRRQELREAVRLAVVDECYDLVWLGTPCSSFSVLHIGAGRPRLRSRKEPEGCTPVPARWKAYLEKHNEFVKFSAEVARAARKAGATYVFENPVDRGMRQSTHFCWRFRGHVPLWIMPRMRGEQVEWVSFPQCAFRGKLQKWNLPDIRCPPTLGLE
ncbi:MAG: hypothetical protein SGPRY_014052 [Prymnesium sp.]